MSSREISKIFPNNLLRKLFFLDSSMVEHSAVNRVVVGSSPTRGVFHRRNRKGSDCEKNRRRKRKTGEKIRLHGQAVKTSPFHGGNTGSMPVGVTPARVADL